MAIFDSPDNNITSLVKLLQYANKLTAGDGSTGLLGIMILIAVGFVSFLSTKGYSAERSLGYTSFLCLITAILLRFINLINDGIMIIVFLIFIGALIFLTRERSSEEGGV